MNSGGGAVGVNPQTATLRGGVGRAPNGRVLAACPHDLLAGVGSDSWHEFRVALFVCDGAVQGMVVHELEPLRPLFVEEPVLAEQCEYYPRLAESTSIPLAAGERMYSRFDFKRLFEAGGISILQPDVSHAGGITECLRIASMAEAYDVSLAPHCPLGPVALAACLQVDLVSQNAVFQEQSMGIHYNEGAELLDYVLNPEDFRVKDGFVAASERPGLGVEIDEARVISASVDAPVWHNPVWRHKDGSVAEWD
jgi:galactonate dehydratase